MYNRSRFSELSDSLQQGFFADRVILALARAKKRGVLEGSERVLIREVADFLHKILEGFNWSENPTLTMNSVEEAEAFSKAARALPEVNSSKSFKKHIERLMACAEGINSSAAIDAEAADELIGFFTNLGEAELQRTDDLINPAKEGIASKTWTGGKKLFA